MWLVLPGSLKVCACHHRWSRIAQELGHKQARLLVVDPVSQGGDGKEEEDVLLLCNRGEEEEEVEMAERAGDKEGVVEGKKKGKLVEKNRRKAEDMQYFRNLMFPEGFVLQLAGMVELSTLMRMTRVNWRWRRMLHGGE